MYSVLTQNVLIKGLEKLYASSKNYEGLARVWPQLIDLYAEQVRLSSNDETAVPLATKAVDLQLKLIATLRDELHRVREACDALKQFLPGSKFEDIVPHAEKAMQVKVPTPLAIWREIARLQDADERASVQREVQARRYRLGAPPLATIRADMEREVLTESTLHISLREVLAATDDEQERHAVSLKLVDLLEKRLRLLQVAAEVKLGIRRELLGLCRELVIDRQVDDLTCMLILIENEDVDTMSDYDQTIIGRVHNAHPKHELAKVHMVWQAYGDGSDATDAIEKIQTIVKDAGSSQLTFTSLVLMSLQLAANDFNGALETARQLKAKLERATMELCFDCPRLMRRADVTIARCYAESNKTEVGLAEEVYKKLLALNREDRECLRVCGYHFSSPSITRLSPLNVRVSHACTNVLIAIKMEWSFSSAFESKHPLILYCFLI